MGRLLKRVEVETPMDGGHDSEKSVGYDLRFLGKYLGFDCSGVYLRGIKWSMLALGILRLCFVQILTERGK